MANGDFNIELVAKLNTEASYEILQEQLDKLAQRLTLNVKVNFDGNEFKQLTAQIDDIQKRFRSAIPEDIINTAKISQDTAKALESVQTITNAYRQLGETKVTINFDEAEREIKGFMVTLTDAQNLVHQFMYEATQNTEMDSKNSWPVFDLKSSKITQNDAVQNQGLAKDALEAEKQLNDEKKQLLNDWAKAYTDHMKSVVAEAKNANKSREDAEKAYTDYILEQIREQEDAQKQAVNERVAQEKQAQQILQAMAKDYVSVWQNVYTELEKEWNAAQDNHMKQVQYQAQLENKVKSDAEKQAIAERNAEEKQAQQIVQSMAKDYVNVWHNSYVELEKEWNSAQDNHLKQLQAQANAENKVRDEANKQRLAQEQQAEKQVEVMSKDYVSYWQKALADRDAMDKLYYQAQRENEARDAQSFESAIQSKIKQLKLFYDLQLTDAKQTYDALLKLYEQNMSYFEKDINTQINMLKTLGEAEKQIAVDEKARMDAIKKNSLSGESAQHSMSHTGFGLSPLQMGLTVAQFQLEATVIENIKQGFMEVQQGAAGIQQVFHDELSDQQSLNQATNQFIGIAEKYGTAINDVTDSAKLWGRQYKDLDVALKLTNNATLLSVVDNLKVVDANKAVESSMNAYGMTIDTTKSKQEQLSQAQEYSMKFIDSWSAVAHGASVSAKDLSDGFERSAAAAKQAGLSVDQLNALVAAGVRNSGRTGAVVGNMWKSVLDNINSGTPKVQEAFKQLGISMTETGKNGEQSLKPTWELIMELSQAAEHADVSQTKWFSAIAGGKYQFDTLLASIKNTKNITDAYKISIDSQNAAQGLATAQLHTFAAEWNRLQDAIQKFSYNFSQSGIGENLKGLIVVLTNFINGLGQLTNSQVQVAAWGIGVVVALRAVIGSFTMVKGAMASIITTVDLLKGKWMILTGATDKYEATLTRLLAVERMQDAMSKITQADIDGLIASQSAMGITITENQAKIMLLTGAETAAEVETTGLTAAFGALNLVSGGVLLAVGAIVVALTAWISHAGAATQATQDLDTSVQSLISHQEQLQSAIDSSATQMYSNLNQLQDLKQNYIDLQNAMKGLSKDSQEYKDDAAKEVEIHRQLIGIVGQREADSIIASNNIVQAINGEIEKLLEARVQYDKNLIEKANTDKANTKSFIDNANERIAKLQEEIKVQGLVAQVDKSVGADTSSADRIIAKDTAELKQAEADLKKAKDAADAATASAQKALDDMNQTQDALNSHKKNPDMRWGDTSPPPKTNGDGGGGGGGGGRGGAPRDPYSVMIDSIDARIQRSQIVMKQYDETSKQYRSELASQISLLKQKSAETEKDLNWTERQASSARRRGDMSTADQMQKQAESLKTSLVDINSQLRQLKDDEALSKVNELLAKINGNLQTSDEKVANLQAQLDNLPSSAQSNRLKLLEQIEQVQEKQYSTLLLNINELRAEQGSLYGNVGALAANKQAMEQLIQKAYQLAGALRQVRASLMGMLVSSLQDLEQADVTSMQTSNTNINNAYDARIKQLQQMKFSMVGYADSMQTVIDKLHELDGQFSGSMFGDSSATIQNNIQAYTTDIAKWADTVQNIGGLDNEISVADTLKQKISGVNVQLEQTTELYREQEASLQNQINQTQTGYDNQISQLEKKLTLLDSQNKAEDRSNQLLDIQNQLQQAMNDNTHTYIDSSGNEITTYDKQKVDQLKKQQDDLVKQFQREDLKSAIQAQETALKDARDQVLKTMKDQLSKMQALHQVELDAMKVYVDNLNNIYQQMVSDINDKVQQMHQSQQTAVSNEQDMWTKLIKGIQDGTISYDDLMNGKGEMGGWFQRTITALGNFGGDVKAKIDFIKTLFEELGKLPPIDVPTIGGSSGGGSGSGSSGGNKSSGNKSHPTLREGSTGSDVKQLQQMLGITADGIFGPQTKQAVENWQKKHHIGVDGIVGNQTWGTLPTHHDGGVVGSKLSPMSALVDKLFNTSPNEQVIKALIGEVMTPQQNIMKNFIPNMGIFAKKVSDGTTTTTTNSYSFDHVTVVANNPTEFFEGIGHLIQSE